MKKFFTLFGILFVFTTTINSQIIHVPADQPTIQEGIEAAADGDTVLVANGTYVENINFMGKAITLASHFLMDNDTSHISNTIIDGSEPDDPDHGSVVTFDSGEDTTSILCGFTITNGTGTKVQGFNAWSGGGIQCYPAGAKILNNKITNNFINATGGGYGAGILCDTENTGWLVICNNTVQHNDINAVNEAIGCGICAFGNARIENNIVIDNSSNAQYDNASSGISCNGIFYDPSAKEIILTNNYIDNNQANSQSNTTDGSLSGGLYIAGYYGVVRNNLITSNSVGSVSDIQCYGAGLMSVRNSVDLIIEGNIITDNFYTSGNCIGGGLCIWDGSGIYQNNVIQNNSGHFGGGVGIAFNDEDETTVLINNTITGNNGVYGGGIYKYTSEAVVINTILWNNAATSEGSQILDLDENLEVRHSDVEGGWPGNGNMNVDPILRPDGYHLDVWSTLLNEGTSSILINGEWYDCPEYDIDGQERPFSFEAEIGADEAMWNYVDIGETKQELSVRMYPNPASSIVNFSLKTNHLPQQNELNIYNTLGETVQSIYFENPDFTINIDQIPAGIYLIKCKIENKEITKKLIISR